MEGTKRKNEGGHGAESESRRKKNKPGKYKSGTKASSSAQMKGPGIFVTCARGRERKAAHELVEALEEIADRLYPNVVLTQLTEEAQEASADEDDLDSLRNGPAQPARQEKQPQALSKSGDIEDQVAQELLELQGTKGPAQRSHTRQKQTPTRFLAVFSDIECFVFIAVARPLDPVKITYAFLEEVRTTGQARSRFVQRLSPVYDTVRAEMSSICQLAEKVFMEHLAASSEPTTYKVDVRVRLHGQLPKMEIVHSVASTLATASTLHCEGRHCADLNTPQRIVNIEVYKLVAGVGLLHDFERYRKLNPLMIVEQVQQSQTQEKDVEQDQ